MSRVLEFVVAGLAQPKGSTRAFVRKGRDGTARAIVTSDNPKNAGWQQTIAQVAAIELRRAGHALGHFGQGGVYFEAVFYLPRPKKLLTKKNAGLTFHHTTKPDADKLLRAGIDALTKVIWHDDAQVVHAVVRKHYCAAGEFPRAVIRIREAVKESPLAQSTLV
jgi:Holliday junction resolvase RusA-like endonuclease